MEPTLMIMKLILGLVGGIFLVAGPLLHRAHPVFVFLSGLGGAMLVAAIITGGG